MDDMLTRFCHWLQNTPMGLAVGRTLWGYPFIQLIHFSGLSLWISSVIMLDLRLLGIAGKRQTVTEFYKQLFPWMWGGLAVVLTGGILLFSAAAESYLHNAAFRVKFPLVLLGIAYHIL